MKKQKITNNRPMSVKVAVTATPAVTATVLRSNANEFKFYKCW